MMMRLVILFALAACVFAFEISFMGLPLLRIPVDETPMSSSGPPVERHDNDEMFPASRSKIHPSPSFRFSQPQMEAQKPHPSFLPHDAATASTSSIDEISNTLTKFAAVAPKQQLQEPQQQQSPVESSSSAEESLSEYEKQLQQFGRQISTNGKINGNDGSSPR